MKSINFSKISHFLATFFGLFIVFFVFPQSAFASRLYLSPGGGNITIGGSKTVQVRLNTGGEAVNAVSAFLSYPADKLDVAWVSPTGTFAIEAEKSFGGGIIKISRGSLSGVSGDVGVASISFRGKAAGSATVSFIGGSQAPRASDSSDSLNLGSSGGGTYTIGGTAKPISSKSSGSSNNQTSTDTDTEAASLKISDIQTIKISTNSATITWKTNQEADSYIEYGLEKDAYFLTESNPTAVTSHSLQLENVMLRAGLKFHFRVHSKDTEGNEAIGEDQEFQLEGYPVVVKVVSETGAPVNKTEVSLYSEPQTTMTDSKGEAVFKNVTEGKHLVVVKLPNGEKTSEADVLGVSKDPTNVTVQVPQQFLVKPKQNSYNWFIVAATTVVVLILASIGFVFLKKKKQRNKPPTANQGQQTIAESSNSETNST